VRLRVSRKDKGLSWLQRAPAEPPFGEDRDRAAFVRFLGARGFLLWVAGLLANDDRQGEGDWTIDDPQNRSGQGAIPVLDSWDWDVKDAEHKFAASPPHLRKRFREALAAEFGEPVRAMLDLAAYGTRTRK
jgi:hypothetical protein